MSKKSERGNQGHRRKVTPIQVTRHPQAQAATPHHRLQKEKDHHRMINPAKANAGIRRAKNMADAEIQYLSEHGEQNHQMTVMTKLQDNPA